MRLTNVLQHGKKFFWGKGWGPKPRTNTDGFYYRMQWNAKRRRPLEVVEQTLPPGVVPVDPNVYVRKEFDKEKGRKGPSDFLLPWPYSKRPVQGTPDDPLYNEKEAYVFRRNKRLIEPINLPLHFSNAILEPGLPAHIQQLRDSVQIDDDFVQFAERRIQHCLSGDSAMRKLTKDREFPYLDQSPPRVWGTTPNKKENNVLHSLYDMASSWMAKKYGFNGEVIRQKVSSPYCVLPVVRDNKLAILDLECEFITLLSSVKPGQAPPNVTPFDSNYAQSTANAELASIHPISWEVAFDDRNIYPTDYDFELPRSSTIQNIFLSNNSVKDMKDADYQGRSILFCYGFAVQQAKLRAQMADIETIELEKPITVSCIFTNPAKPDFKVGTVLFQLNTLQANDQSRRNQVWFTEPRVVPADVKEAMADLITVQSVGIYN